MVVGIDFCQSTRQVMLSQYFKPKDQGIGKYITCPVPDIKRNLNTGIFQMTETFNYIYSDLVEILSESPYLSKLTENLKRNNTNYKELIHDSGYQNDFSLKYQMPTCLMNIGFCGFVFLLYLNIII